MAAAVIFCSSSIPSRNRYCRYLSLAQSSSHEGQLNFKTVGTFSPVPSSSPTMPHAFCRRGTTWRANLSAYDSNGSCPSLCL